MDCTQSLHTARGYFFAIRSLLGRSETNRANTEAIRTLITEGIQFLDTSTSGGTNTSTTTSANTGGTNTGATRGRKPMSTAARQKLSQAAKARWRAQQRQQRGNAQASRRPAQKTMTAGAGGNGEHKRGGLGPSPSPNLRFPIDCQLTSSAFSPESRPPR